MRQIAGVFGFLYLSMLSPIYAAHASAGIIHVKAGDSATLERIAGDAHYANYVIDLAPGRYVLKNLLSLQKNQSILGHQQYVDRDGDGVWDPVDANVDPADPNATYVKANATIIDLSAVQPAIGNDFAIALRSGNNLEGVTIQGAGPLVDANTNLKSVICTGSAKKGGNLAPCRVANTVIVDTALALAAVYYGSALPNPSVADTYSVNFENNVVWRSGVAGGVESGVDTLVTRVSFKQNRLSGGLSSVPGGGYGLFVNIEGTSNTVDLSTVGNVVDKNDVTGVLIIAGLAGVPFPTPPANLNKVNWSSLADRVTRNGNTPEGAGGISLLGVVDVDPSPSSHGNQVKANLVGTVFVSSTSSALNSSVIRDASGNVTSSYQQDLLQVPVSTLPGASQVVDNSVALTALGLKSNTRQTHTSTFYAAIGDPNNSATISPATEATFNALNPNFLWRVNIDPTGPK